MSVTVAGQFVASFGNLTNKRRIAFSYPAQHKESSAPIIFGEEFKEAVAIRMHARSKGWPIFRANLVSKRLNVKIVFDVDAERVGDRVERPAQGNLGLIVDS